MLSRALAWLGLGALYVVLFPFTLWVVLEALFGWLHDLCGAIADRISDSIPHPIFERINVTWEWLVKRATKREE